MRCSPQPLRARRDAAGGGCRRPSADCSDGETASGPHRRLEGAARPRVWQGARIRGHGGRRSARAGRDCAGDSRNRGRAPSKARSEVLAPLSIEAAASRMKPAKRVLARVAARFGCRLLASRVTLGRAAFPYQAVWRLAAVDVPSRIVLAMQSFAGAFGPRPTPLCMVEPIA